MRAVPTRHSSLVTRHSLLVFVLLLFVFQCAIGNGKSKMEIGCLAWFRSRSSGFRDRRTPDYATRQWSPGKVLPLRLLGVGQTRYYFTTERKLAAGDGFAPSTALSKSAELLVTPSRNELVEPDVVATSPNRIKSPVPVFCGFSSEKWWAREDLHPATAGLADSRSAGSSIPAQPLAQKILKLEPPAGAAPAGFLYKRNPQAAAWRQNGRNPECCPRLSWLMMPA